MSQPTQRPRIRRVRTRESDAEFMSRKRLESNRFWTDTFIVLIMATAAATTFSFGLIGSWGNVDLTALPPQQFWWTIWRGVAAAMVVTLLLDGARLGWSRARVAAKTTPWMQYLAIGMEIATFGASVMVSMMGLPPLLTQLGLELTFDPEMLNVMLTLTLQYSLAANLVAVFLYLILSPESLRLMKVADIESQRQQVYLLKFSKILDNVIRGEGKQIESFLRPIADDWIQDGAADFLGQQGYQRLPAPPPAGGDRRPPSDGGLNDLENEPWVQQMGNFLREAGFGQNGNGQTAPPPPTVDYERPHVNGSNGVGPGKV